MIKILKKKMINFKRVIKKLLSWKYISRVLKIVEVVAVVAAAVVIVEIPKQLNEWENGQNNRAFDQLIKLDGILSQGTDRKITSALDKDQPILIENGGTFSSNELDNYLNDIYSIYDAYNRGIISGDDVYTWFSDYLAETVENKEVIKYLNYIRTDSPDYYRGLEDFVGEINSE